MALQYSIANLVNLLAFVGLTIATYTIFYFGKMMNPTKGIGINLFTLSLGINSIGLSHLFRIWLDVATSPLILILVATGSFLLTTGVIWVFYEKTTEINSVVAKMKEKYYRKEIDEGDLKAVYSTLMKELAEIEVRLSKKRK